MKFSLSISATFNCSLERAFKTPLLCDVAKVHTGYGLMPRITHCTDDEDWGRVGATKKVYAAGSWTQKGGFVSVDRILEREENVRWVFQVDSFQSWMLGFHKFVGEWQTTEIDSEHTQVVYSYTLHASNPLFYPLCWLFAQTFWKAYMRRVLENVRQMTQNHEPYRYG